MEFLEWSVFLSVKKLVFCFWNKQSKILHLPAASVFSSKDLFVFPIVCEPYLKQTTEPSYIKSVSFLLLSYDRLS